MKPYEFTRFYHPQLGQFVYKHKGSGLIIDNIFKPMKNVLTSVFKKVVKPTAKKAVKTGISKAGEKIGKKVAEKSGEMIMKNLAKARATPPRKTIAPKVVESTDTILNRLISGSGRKRKIM